MLSVLSPGMKWANDLGFLKEKTLLAIDLALLKEMI